MSVKSLLIPAGGIKTKKRKLADGQEHDLFFKSKTTDEMILFAGAMQRLPDTPEGDLKRQKLQADFIASSLCDEAGALLMTPQEAYDIQVTMKPDLCNLILDLSQELGDQGKGLPPEVRNGSGTSSPSP